MLLTWFTKTKLILICTISKFLFSLIFQQCLSIPLFRATSHRQLIVNYVKNDAPTVALFGLKGSHKHQYNEYICFLFKISLLQPTNWCSNDVLKSFELEKLCDLNSNLDSARKGNVFVNSQKKILMGEISLKPLLFQHA